MLVWDLKLSLRGMCVLVSYPGDICPVGIWGIVFNLGDWWVGLYTVKEGIVHNLVPTEKLLKAGCRSGLTLLGGDSTIGRGSTIRLDDLSVQTQDGSNNNTSGSIPEEFYETLAACRISLLIY